MDEPLEIVFDGLDTSAAAEETIRENHKKLDRFYDHIIDARVVVSKPGHRHNHGELFHVTLEVNVPGNRLVVSKDPGDSERHENLSMTLNDAYKAMIRQLEDYARKQRGEVKQHAAPLEGRIVKLFPEENYGFIELNDGREVYFHENSVHGLKMKLLETDMPVRVVMTSTESAKGPQATTVEPVNEMQFWAKTARS